MGSPKSGWGPHETPVFLDISPSGGQTIRRGWESCGDPNGARHRSSAPRPLRKFPFPARGGYAASCRTPSLVFFPLLPFQAIAAPSQSDVMGHNSSGVISASRIIARCVPGGSVLPLWNGTTVCFRGSFQFLKILWLPFCRSSYHPRSSRSAIICCAVRGFTMRLSEDALPQEHP